MDKDNMITIIITKTSTQLCFVVIIAMDVKNVAKIVSISNIIVSHFLVEWYIIAWKNYVKPAIALIAVKNVQIHWWIVAVIYLVTVIKCALLAGKILDSVVKIYVNSVIVLLCVKRFVNAIILYAKCADSVVAHYFRHFQNAMDVAKY